MAKILLDNPDGSGDFSKKKSEQEKKNEQDDVTNHTDSEKAKWKAEMPRTESFSKSESVPPEIVKTSKDDYAVFPEWDVVPPNAIINPRLKKKI